jgi:hypothetical protein
VGRLQRGLVAAAMTVPLLTLALAAAEPLKTITGRVTGLEGDVVTVRIEPGESIEILLVSGTRYRKWITQKPWQQSTRAKRSFLEVGKRVSIDVAAGEKGLEARVVRIATD